jgi:ATP-dependent Lhr-like helicase
MSLILKDQMSWAHPLIAEWFQTAIGQPTEPQVQGWPAILAGLNTLISAPTGSGKTFAAFLTCIDDLVRQSIAGTLPDQTEVIYVSPLKALSNDIHKNLTGPLEQITQLASARGLTMSEIRVAVRTGDTLAKERQAMLKTPPHILVTTPESLYILLTAEKSRDILKNVKTVIIDEIHVLVNDKRGAHLTLSLERLTALTQKKLTRIGLSATQKPIELVGKFLTGNNHTPPVLVNIGYARQLELKVAVPSSELGAVASNEMWDEIYDHIAILAKQNRSTLVFVNTRRLAERVAHHLTERLGEDQVLAHHGSLSRKLRLTAENKLKNGELKALIATASLELGIDIGSIDLVCQIGSPRAIATALQRVGRSGHWHGAISKGVFFATTRDELIECAALIHAIHTENLDQLIIPDYPLDVLAQQIVATCVTGEWREDDLFKLMKQAYPYKNLTREDFDSIISMLSDGIASSRGRYGAYLFRDQVNGVVNARRGARLTAITNGGAIPDNGLFTVIAEPAGTMVGTLDEDFAVESNRGDIILLGTTSWKIKRIESVTGRVLVEDAHGAPPSVPFWRGEAPARTDELSLEVSELREKVENSLDDVEGIKVWLQKNCGLDKAGSEQLVEYLMQGKTILNAIPTQKTIIAERFFDESGGMQLIIHAPFGARINKAWGLALRKRFCHSFNFELQAAATDNGLNISLAEQHSFPLVEVFRYLHPNTIKETLIQSVLQSPLFTTRWRWVAVRSLALARFRGGKKVPPNLLRMRADDLLAAVFPDAAACQDNLAGKLITPPEHPLIDETMKDALTEALDMHGLIRVIQQILNEEIRCIAVDTPVPSVFSHELLNASPYAYLDDAPLEERRARAVEMRRVLPDSVLQEIGKLDPEAIKEVQRQAWPDIRNADELHDFLQTVVALPVNESLDWQIYGDELILNGRAGIAIDQCKKFLLATEKAKTFLSIYPSAKIEQELKEIEINIPNRDESILNMVRGWIFHLGPTTSSELAIQLNLDESEVNQALLRLESSGVILRGQFRFTSQESLEWCERRLLARIHRETIGKLRKAIAPVTRAQFMYWLLLWQHLLPEARLRGERGLLEVIKQLQGFDIPANAWENQIFSKRIVDYQFDMLDNLCLRGIIGWGRISSPYKLNEEPVKRIMPTSVAPITFFVREECDWLSHPPQEECPGLTHVANDIFSYLKKYGASFFVDIVKGVNHFKSEVETGLWELVTAGLITADGFDNLRSLIDPKRRLGRGRRRIKSYGSGRWTVLQAHEVETNKRLESLCWVLLYRYGVIFRDLLVREKNLPRWRDLLITLRRLEDRGEIRGGRFVDGFLGEQFALPHAVESLRNIKKKSPQALDIIVSSVDPLNLLGIILLGERETSSSGKNVYLKFDIIPHE